MRKSQDSKRLTYIDNLGRPQIYGSWLFHNIKNAMGRGASSTLRELIVRLAEYENIGTVSQFKELTKEHRADNNHTCEACGSELRTCGKCGWSKCYEESLENLIRVKDRVKILELPLIVDQIMHEVQWHKRLADRHETEYIGQEHDHAAQKLQAGADIINVLIDEFE